MVEADLLSQELGLGVNLDWKVELTEEWYVKLTEDWIGDGMAWSVEGVGWICD